MHPFPAGEGRGRLARRWLRELGAVVFDVVCPPHCAACGAHGPAVDAGLCAACRRCVVHRPLTPCPRCGAARLEGQARCTGDHRAVAGLVAVRAPFAYRGTAGELVRRLKFSHDRSAGFVLARAMAWELRGIVQGRRRRRRMVVLSVPLAVGKRRRRGFDQAAWLAEQVADRVALRYLPGALRRVRDTLPQGDPRVTSRARNVEGAFAAAAWRARRCRGRHVVLVDDVATSFHTARECARVLRRAGARSVSLLAAARAREGGH